MDTKLANLKPGLIRLNYSDRGNPYQELALLLSPDLTSQIALPNNALAYRPFLRESMKVVQQGMRAIGPFSSYELKDRFIDGLEDRSVKLNDGFYNVNNNFNLLSIPCNHPAFHPAIDELKSNIKKAGFDIDNSTWEGYKSWEPEHLDTFQIITP
jgi:hypothetical protein